MTFKQTSKTLLELFFNILRCGTDPSIWHSYPKEREERRVEEKELKISKCFYKLLSDTDICIRTGKVICSGC